MEWYLILLLISISLFVLLFIGMPVAFAFLMVTILGALVFIGGSSPAIYIREIYSTLAAFTLLPIPLFILMGELLFHSGMAIRVIDGLSKLMGSIPARLSVLTIAGGTLLGAVTGATIGSTAILGSLLLPEMLKRGYSKALSIGPILAGGGLAMLIPPSVLSVVYANAAEISVGNLLIAGVVPGVLMAILFAAYVIIQAIRKPYLAPKYDVSASETSNKLKAIFVDIVPIGFIIFIVTGLIILGVATPSEAAATGVVGVLIAACLYRNINFSIIKTSLLGTIKITSMTLLLVAASVAFSRLLAMTGVTKNLVEFIIGLDASSGVILLILILIVILLGTIMDATAIILICVPLFNPIVHSLGFDPLWFGVMFLMAVQIGLITPPFGILLFTIKGVMQELKMKDIWYSAVPFIAINVVAILVVRYFPQVVLWLPSLIS